MRDYIISNYDGFNNFKLLGPHSFEVTELQIISNFMAPGNVVHSIEICNQDQVLSVEEFRPFQLRICHSSSDSARQAQTMPGHPRQPLPPASSSQLSRLPPPVTGALSCLCGVGHLPVWLHTTRGLVVCQAGCQCGRWARSAVLVLVL